MFNPFLKIRERSSNNKINKSIDTIFHNTFFEDLSLSGLDIPAGKLNNHVYIYQWFTSYYKKFLPPAFQLHRQYFNMANRGFGEDAFHALWFLVFQKYRPSKILEIGVYRGQTLSYFNLLGKYFNYPVDVHGISPLDDSGDSYSGYEKINYAADIALNFSKFGLPTPNLHKGYSNDNAMLQFIASNTWDLIYIDGSHDYDIVTQDINASLAALKTGGVLVMDDASLYQDYIAPEGSFKGHPGTSKAADELKASGRCTNLINVGHNRVFIKK